jgi:hypothetical protein
MKTLTLALLLSITLTLSAAQAPPGAQEVAVVGQFDKNNDGWLNSAERQPAREFAQNAAIGQRGRGGRGGRGGAIPVKGEAILPEQVKTYPNAPFYDESVLRTLFFTFENMDWEKELEDFRYTDVDVPATLVADGKTYPNVGLRFRGNSSYSGVPEGRKRSFNVTIDMAVKDQNVGGYRTLNLLNSNQDPTFMRSVLFMHIAREYIPAPKANFVRVVINGENWGIYANVQQFNKDFLKENYKDTTGSRWKIPQGRAGLEFLGEDAANYRRIYELKTKEDPAEWNALIGMTKVLNQTPPEQLEKALAPLLDIDSALRFLALDNGLVNGDGYWTRGSDFSMYRDASGKFHVVPHDTNETFSFAGAGGRGRGAPTTVGGGVDPLIGLTDATKPLRSKLLSIPALRDRYMSYVREIGTKWLDWKTLGPIVERHRALIEDDVRRDTRKLQTYEAFSAGIDGPAQSLKAFAEMRQAQLSQ